MGGVDPGMVDIGRLGGVALGMPIRLLPGVGIRLRAPVRSDSNESRVIGHRALDVLTCSI